jgi:hypothetical protein
VALALADTDTASQSAGAKAIMDDINRGSYALLNAGDEPRDVAALLHRFCAGLQEPLVPATMRCVLGSNLYIFCFLKNKKNDTNINGDLEDERTPT